MQSDTNIYVDANATYPVISAHYDAVSDLLKKVDGNPSSIHTAGRRAKVAIEDARSAVASQLGARSPEIIFTSGATEANNLVLQGVIGRMSVNQPRAGGHNALPHMIVVASEHSSVIEPARLLAERGLCSLSLAPVDHLGRVTTQAIIDLLRSETVLVAVMHANNETGTIHDVIAIAQALRAQKASAHVHVDAVQSFGKLDLRPLLAAGIDSMAISGHKLGAFKGVGALWLKAGTKLAALLPGGGQERGRRAGTENMPGILSLGLRCGQLEEWRARVMPELLQLRNAWICELATIPGVVVHGTAGVDPEGRESLPNTVNFHVEGVLGDDILLNFDLAGIQASSGSACSSGTARPSSVLLAMGYDEQVALNSVRISFWDQNQLQDLELMKQCLLTTIARVRTR